MPTAVLGVDILSVVDKIWLPVEHITYFVEYWGWSSVPPVECGAPHPASGITSSQCPHSVPMVTSAALTRAAPRLSAHVPPPPPPRRVPPPAPRASAAGRRNVAKLARSLAAEHMPSEASGCFWGLWGQDGQRFAIWRAKEFVTWRFVNVSSSFVRRIQKDFLHSSHCHWFLIFNVLYFQICKCKHYFRFKYLLKLVIFQMMPQWQWPTSSLYSWYSSAPSVSSTSRLL